MARDEHPCEVVQPSPELTTYSPVWVFNRSLKGSDNGIVQQLNEELDFT
jgi:hypothetical protein